MSHTRRRARILRAAIDRSGPEDPTQADWNEWIELARSERVLPLLYRVATSPTSELTREQRDHATEIQLDVMATMVRFEHDLLDVTRELVSHGIQFAVLKGMATTHLDYADPALRQFADADVLVAPHDMSHACDVLAAAGWRQAYPLPRFHESFTHAVTLRNGRRIEIDLHQRIAHRAIGELIRTEALLADRVEFSIAGTPLWALSDRDRLIHAAVHALTSRGVYRRLSSTADVLVLSDAQSGSAAAILDRAESWRVRPIVERSVRAAYSDAALTLPEAWTAAIARPLAHRDRLVEHAYLSARRRPLLEELAYLRLMHGVSDRVRYVRGYFATDSEYAARNQRRGIIPQSKYLWSRIRSGSAPPE